MISVLPNIYGNELIYISIEKEAEIGRLDLSDLWIHIEDGESGGQQSSGPNAYDTRNGLLAMGSPFSCMNQLIDPFKYEENEPEWNLWINQNGDYVGDHNFEEDSEKPWICHDYNVGPYKYNISLDENMFSIFPAYDMGAISFGMYAPDGTGIAYFAYSSETARFKAFSRFCDYGSAYDGIYCDGASALSEVEAGYTATDCWFIAHDSIQGVITSAVAVEEAPVAFAVAQNSPNPFNPTTTISITIPESGTVSIDIFNVAGQKVDTITNEFMSAGSHSVTWDATGFSAGVYFYTARLGNFTKTMKMTLMK